MAYCTKCGQENIDSANFCLRCGHRINIGEPDQFDKRVEDFANGIEKFATDVGKKAEVVAKRIYEDVRKAGKKVGDKAMEIERGFHSESKYCMHCGVKLDENPDESHKCGNKMKY